MKIEEAKKMMEKAQKFLSDAEVERKTHQKLLEDLRPKLAAKEEECQTKFGVTIDKLRKAIPKREADFVAGVQALASNLGLDEEE